MRNQDAGLIIGICLGACISFLVVGTMMNVGAGISGSAALTVSLAVGAAGFVCLVIFGPRYIWPHKRESSSRRS